MTVRVSKWILSLGQGLGYLVVRSDGRAEFDRMWAQVFVEQPQWWSLG